MVLSALFLCADDVEEICNPVRKEKRLSPREGDLLSRRKKRYFLSATSYEKRGRGKDSTQAKKQIFFLLFSPLSLSLRHFLLLLLLLLLLDFFFSAVGAKKGTKRPQNKLERISEKERERDDELFPRESFRWWW